MTAADVRAVVLAAAETTALPGAGQPPTVPGFIESRFSPLVKAVIDRCLAAGAPEGLGDSGRRTALLLVTTFGDATTTDLAARRLAEGQPHNPLLFYQSVPTSILGFVTREHGITGPVSCVSARDPQDTPAVWDTAELLLLDEDVDQLLLVGIELAPNPRTAAVRAALGEDLTAVPAEDAAAAVLLRRAAPAHGPAALRLQAPRPPAGQAGEDHRPGPAQRRGPGHLHGLGALLAAAGRQPESDTATDPRELE